MTLAPASLRRHAPGPVTEAMIVALGLAIFYLFARTSPFLAAGVFNDDGIYLALGKAIAEGEGYRSIYAVGEPVHGKYPPGLPAVYAVLWWLGSDLGSVYAAAILLSLAFTSLAAGIIWWLARVRMGLGVPVSLFFALGPFLLEGSVQYFNMTLSEPYFLVLWAMALGLFPRVVGRERDTGSEWNGKHLSEPGEAGASAEPSGEPRSAWFAAGLGATVAAAVLFRSQGVVLVPAVLLGLLVLGVRGRGIALFSVAAVLPLAAWRFLHGRALARGPVGTQPDEEAYVAWMPAGGLGELPGVIGELVAYQVRSYGTYMPTHLSGYWTAGLVLWLAFTALVIVAGVRQARRHPDLVLACAASAAVIFLWPWWQDRFVLTILPFLALLAGSEVQRWQEGRPARQRAVPAVLALLALAIGVQQVAIRAMTAAEREQMPVQSHPAHFLPNNTRYLLAANSWLEEHTSPDATVLAPHPAGIWLHTGRQVVNSTPALPDIGPSVWDQPGRFLAERLAEDGPDLVVLANLVYDITMDISVLQQTCPEALEHLGATERFARVVFFRVRYDDACLQERFLAPVRAGLGS